MKKYKYLDIVSLRTEFYKRFPNSKIVLVNFLSERLIRIQDTYGFCDYSLEHILHEGTSSINNSINKTEYFINQAKEVHGDKYDYSLVNYVNSKTKIKILCKEHGLFEIKPVKHLSNQSCRKCGYEKIIKSNKLNNKIFIEKANNIHNYKYDYSLINYKSTYDSVKIICPIHGSFEQKASNHLRGSGCTKCKNNSTSIRNIENPTGWTYSNWEKIGNKSKNFDSFKIYIIKCWGNNEEFYKIGKTFTLLNKRFPSKTRLPYNWKIIKLFKGEAKKISELENKLKYMNKENRYTPILKFKGMYECFNKINNYEEFFT